MAGASGKKPASQCRKYERHGFDIWGKKILWRKAWQSTPVFLPSESHGQRSLTGYSPWDGKELDTTEATWQAMSSKVALVVKKLPANAGNVKDTGRKRRGFNPWVGKIPLEEEMAPHSSIFDWRIHGQRSLVGYSLWGQNSWTQLSIRARLITSSFILPQCQSFSKM